MNVPPNSPENNLGRLPILLDSVATEYEPMKFSIDHSREEIDRAIEQVREEGLDAFSEFAPGADRMPTHEEWTEQSDYGLYARVVALKHLLKALVLSAVASGCEAKKDAGSILGLVDSLTIVEDELNCADEIGGQFV